MNLKQLRTWKDGYIATMAKTSFVSKVVVLIFSVIAIVESIRVFRFILIAEEPSGEAILRAFVSPILFLVVFGTRFAYLNVKQIRFLGTALTWWVCAMTVHAASSFSMYGCVLNCDPNASYPIYDMFSMFPLESAGVLFIFFCPIRFLATVFGAFQFVNE
jgi:hypothetical protein